MPKIVQASETKINLQFTNKHFLHFSNAKILIIAQIRQIKTLY